MNERLASVRRWQIPPGRRILVISDIHGELDYLQALLKKAGFCRQDLLVIDGDFLEKGPRCLDTLRYIMELTKEGNVQVVRGNCDGWHRIREYQTGDYSHLLGYLRWRQSGFIWEILKAQGIDPMEAEDLSQCEQILESYSEELDFLAGLPDVIETEGFIFAHAGMDPSKPLEEHLARELDRIDRFMAKGYSFDKWLIVGHYPVVLYGEDRVCADPVIDREHHVISIDGGCVLKDDGQLNALVIPHKDSRDFSWIAYDPFPERRVLQDQEESKTSYYIRWGDNEVLVLDRGEEFSRCRHIRTGYEMDILTRYLFSPEPVCRCNDCTDYELPLKKGDLVRVVETSSRGYFVKHGGSSGWYRGALE